MNFSFDRTNFFGKILEIFVKVWYNNKVLHIKVNLKLILEEIHKMSIFEIISAIVLIIACVFIVVVVLLKDTKTQMSQTISGTASDSFYQKNAGRTKEAMLNKATIAAVIIFFVMAVAVNVINVYWGGSAGGSSSGSASSSSSVSSSSSSASGSESSTSSASGSSSTSGSASGSTSSTSSTSGSESSSAASSSSAG